VVTSTDIRLAVGLTPATRAAGIEPHFVLWSIARHLAGPNQRWVDRGELRRVVVGSRIWRPARFNQLVREGEGLFWTSRIGRRDGRPILYLRGKARLVAAFRERSDVAVHRRVAILPLGQLRGVAHRRAVAFEGLVGTSLYAPASSARPQARGTLEAYYSVAPRTQLRWNGVAGSLVHPAELHLREVHSSYRIDPKYDEPGCYTRWVRRSTGRAKVLVKRLGNVYLSRFPAFQGRRVGADEGRHPPKKGGCESGTQIRYTDDVAMFLRLRRKGAKAYLRTTKVAFPLAGERQHPVVYVADTE
jgi:hypothetical protein